MKNQRSVLLEKREVMHRLFIWKFLCNFEFRILVECLITVILRSGFLSTHRAVMWSGNCFLFLFLFLFLFSFFETGFLCSFGACPRTSSCRPSWPRTQSDPPGSPSQVLGLKACATTTLQMTTSHHNRDLNPGTSD